LGSKSIESKVLMKESAYDKILYRDLHYGSLKIVQIAHVNIATNHQYDFKVMSTANQPFSATLHFHILENGLTVSEDHLHFSDLLPFTEVIKRYNTEKKHYKNRVLHLRKISVSTHFTHNKYFPCLEIGKVGNVITDLERFLGCFFVTIAVGLIFIGVSRLLTKF
jgi:hypothetical protein